MGILERDYYRDKQPAWVGRISVCTWLIILNIVIYLVQLATRNTAGSPVGPFTAALWLDPDELLDGQVWRLLTCAFLHTPFSPFHILFNMLFLWLLGREIEEIYGSREFAAFYVLAALLASFGYLATVWTGVIGKAPMLGASGAVTAVLVVYAMHFPNRMFLLFLIIPVPAWVFVVFNVAKDLFGVLGRAGQRSRSRAPQRGGVRLAVRLFRLASVELVAQAGPAQAASAHLPRANPDFASYSAHDTA
jgi:membrane associated rhomboid family serine protease